MVLSGITRDHVLKAIADLDAGVSHDFGPSTKYDLVHEGRRYPPKAIVGLAARYLTGQPLTPQDFSGGVDSACFRLLQNLGFEVVPKPLSAQAVARFRVGDQYTRNDVYRILDVPQDRQGGNWDTGYHRYNDEWFIFANVGGAGRTGHDYPNRFEGNHLVWVGRTGARHDHQSIQSMVSGEIPVHVFFRTADRESFTYQGLAHPTNVDAAKVPVEVRWAFDEAAQPRPERAPEELSAPEVFIEGARQVVVVNAYERNPAARRRCIEHHGCHCAVCGFDFERTYGDLGKGYIQVHHLRPLAKVGGEYELDPVADLRPVCPNCHAMIHARDPVLSIEELRARLGTPSS